MRPAAPGFRELVSANLPQLSAIIPEFAEPFYMVAESQRVAENTMMVDWGLTRAQYMLMRYVRDADQLRGVKGEGKILWRCYGHWSNPHAAEIHYLATLRGFQTLDSMEFFTWLKKRMQHSAHLPASAGLRALEASLLKPPLPNPTKAAKPAGRAQ